jgi:hypothetical protein
MRSSFAITLFVTSVLCLAAACGPNVAGSDDDGDDTCTGCVCEPGAPYCEGNDIHECNADGSGGDLVGSCTGDQVCAAGHCVSACEQAELDRSNVGCEYWAVDLDNEYSQFNDAAAEQFSVVLANTSANTVAVTVEQNDAAPGAPLQLTTVRTVTIAPDALVQIDLPRREVDGSLAGHDEGTGTNLSSRAYRVRTDYPVVAYQFNPIVQSFSNGASLLIPTSGLDNQYAVLGWPTANPISGGFTIPGIPDHSFVAIVGTENQPTHVTIRTGGNTVAGAGVPASGAGGTIEVDLGAFDVLNLESSGIPGDLTGTVVDADGPVAVFSGGERAIVPGSVEPPQPDGYDPADLCCTEHFEQQVFPMTALGTRFVTTRSPVRSGNVSIPEADVWRVLATEANTQITTNLPPPYDHFSLSQYQYAEFWSQTDFVLESTPPVAVAQYLVSQGFVDSPTVGGDPEFILFPPSEQYRDEYIFLVPTTFEKNYAIIAMPDGAAITLDGQPVGPSSSQCQQYPAGMLEGVQYHSLRCELAAGAHHVAGSLPIGVTVYGYYNVGSYGYAAGSQLTRINIP